ncbi:MAG TPA: hypothetical protein VGL21_15925 [Jatrophihabitantaceae bacterium]
MNVRVEDGDGLDAGIAAAMEHATTFPAAGVDLVVINLPLAAKPTILQPIAEAFAPLA